MTKKETCLVLENARRDLGEGDLKYTPFIPAKKTHPHLAFVISGKVYNQHSLLGKMTLQ